MGGEAARSVCRLLGSLLALLLAGSCRNTPAEPAHGAPPAEWRSAFAPRATRSPARFRVTPAASNQAWKPRGAGYEVIEGAEPRTAADATSLAYLDTIHDCIARERTLEFRESLAVGFYDQTQLAEQLGSDFFDAIGREEFGARALASAAFGLVPRHVDLAMLTTQSTAARLLGFYDPKRRRLQCISGNFDSQAQMVMVHEAVHALQDQNFGLLGFAFTHEAQSAADAFVARLAVMEGDAALTTQRVLAECGTMMGDSDEDIAGMFAALAKQAALGSVIPPLLADGAGILYQECANFVEAVQKQGGWEAVDALYRNPPRSSEQVLHPEKLLDPRHADEPIPVRSPDLTEMLGAGWAPIGRNRLGEVGTRQLIRFTGDPADAYRAATGWGGDEYLLYARDDDELLLQWVSVWDSERDAVEMMRALERIVTRQAAGTSSLTVTMDTAAKLLQAHDADGALRELARRDEDCLVWIRGLLPGLDAEALAQRCLP